MKSNPASEMAKLRWKDKTKEERFTAMSHVAKEGWKKRRKNKAKIKLNEKK